MKTNSKPDFLDDVVDEMGDGKGGTKYGASMNDNDGDEDYAEDDTAKEDRLMAARQVGKAMGLKAFDPQKLADGLEAFVKTCM